MTSYRDLQKKRREKEREKWGVEEKAKNRLDKAEEIYRSLDVEGKEKEIVKKRFKENRSLKNSLTSGKGGGSREEAVKESLKEEELKKWKKLEEQIEKMSEKQREKFFEEKEKKSLLEKLFG